MAKKHYVVWKGAQTGVFDTWAEVQSHTQGRADAQFMGFNSKQEAELAFQSTYTRALMKRSLEKGQGSKSTTGGSSTSTSKTSSKSSSYHASNDADVNIYCDGACSPNPGKSGTGIAIYHKSELKALWYGLYNANGTNNTAELNGLLEAFKLAQNYISQGLNVQVLSDSKYSIDCVTKWATGWQKKGWKKANGEAIKNPELVQACFNLYQQIKTNLKVSHVKGHANIEGNELSDRMAVYARSQHEKSFVQFQENLNIKAILAMESG
ncbi:ribonuclease H family protein [Thalassotalea sp. PLHSN55]|uniref:ribonuclease H family protein n=1 Tax=Thalassotalea sp. PLHSN55 TaxID=3435888 RepID=UPI003F87F8FA